MRTTPNQNFFSSEKPTANTEQDGAFNDLKNLIEKKQVSTKPYSHGSEPENEDQITPNKGR